MQMQTRSKPVACDDSGGAGIPLVLIHGFPLDRTIWSAQVRGLADVARVIAPDLRGFGESALQRTAATTTMDDYAADVAELLDSLEIEDAVIGGVSMGGYVAMAFHRAYPRRVRGLVLVDTRGGPDSAEARDARDKAAALARARGTAAVAAQMLEKMLTRRSARSNERMRLALSELMAAQPVEGVVAALTAIRDRPDARPSKARITVPTLVVCGAEDELIPPSESEALRDAIRWARLVLIPGAAHLPNYEQPDAFNRAVREYLAIFS